jgi:hypothetical protein
MKRTPPDDDTSTLTRTWIIPSTARLGSSVRSKGIFLEVRAHLPVAARKALSVKAGELILAMPADSAELFAAAAASVDKTLEGIESLPVIPREIEDILSIKTSERHRWLKDGRLPSAGTRTVKLPGRAKKITFHVFDPHVVEDILDRGVIDTWREEDAERAAENRRQAAWKAKLTRAQKTAPRPAPETDDDEDRFKLRGWAEFERLGLLR